MSTGGGRERSKGEEEDPSSSYTSQDNLVAVSAFQSPSKSCISFTKWLRTANFKITIILCSCMYLLQEWGRGAVRDGVMGESRGSSKKKHKKKKKRKGSKYKYTDDIMTESEVS